MFVSMRSANILCPRTLILFSCLIFSFKTLAAHQPQPKLRTFSLIVDEFGTPCDSLTIANPFPKKKIFVTNVSVEKRKQPLINAQGYPKKPGVVSWSYNADSAVLNLKSSGKGLRVPLEIAFVINLDSNQQAETFEVLTYHSGKPKKQIISAHLVSQ